MREEFAMTKNVQRFIHGVEVVKTPIKGRIGNGLFFGPPGTGKTDVGQWYASQHDVPYIRAKDISSRRSLLANIVAELGEAPEFRTDLLFGQIVDQLIERPRPIIIDEVDYLIKGGAVEVLRDINDMTNTPIIMMGMENVDKKLKRFGIFSTGLRRSSSSSCSTRKRSRRSPKASARLSCRIVRSTTSRPAARASCGSPLPGFPGQSSWPAATSSMS